MSFVYPIFIMIVDIRNELRLINSFLLIFCRIFECCVFVCLEYLICRNTLFKKLSIVGIKISQVKEEHWMIHILQYKYYFLAPARVFSLVGFGVSSSGLCFYHLVVSFCFYHVCRHSYMAL
jgi:hypothetical protein